MSKMYLRELIEFAQKEVPLLGNDFQNASTQYSLQACCQRLFNLTTYMLHHIVHAACEGGSVATEAPAPAAPPSPVVVPSQQPPTGMPRLPLPIPSHSRSPALPPSPASPMSPSSLASPTS